MFLTTQGLRAMGCTVERVRAEIALGLLERVIRGRYCRPGAGRDVVRAMRFGGRLSGISALRLLDAWYPPDAGPHVGFPSHASGRRSAEGRVKVPDGTVRHWHPKASATGSASVVTPAARSIEDLLVCQPRHLVVAVLDSLLHKRLIHRTRLDALVLAAPDRVHVLAEHLNAASESGIESIVRFRLALAGVSARVQVVFRERYRLEVDGWLVLEIDGRQAHAQEKAFANDRVRAATTMRDGKVVLQLSYATVVDDWDFVLASILDVLRQHAPVR